MRLTGCVMRCAILAANPDISDPPNSTCGRAALKTDSSVIWRTSSSLVDYEQALSEMEAQAAAIASGNAREQVWLLEHPPLYTAGTSAKADDLVDPDRFPVFQAGRGGQYTYHGPGQRVGYLMLDLRERGRDVRCFVSGVEQLVIDTLAEFGVTGERRDGRVGVWVVMQDGSDAKIAAIGIRIRRWVSFHGLSINVNPDLSHFGGIVPCGISEHGVTSLSALGVDASMADVDTALKCRFESLFGPTVRA